MAQQTATRQRAAALAANNPARFAPRRQFAPQPRAVLARGYAIVRGVACVGSEITIQQSKQTITAEVTHVAANE